jgi:hypothetical protein
VAQKSRPLPFLNFEAVRSVKAARGGKAEEYRLVWVVLFDGVPDRSVAANRANRQRTVKAHRRPFVAWPKAIVTAGKRVD